MDNLYSKECESSINKAIKLAGSQRKLAILCGHPIKQSHVFYWKNKSKKIPSSYVLHLEKKFNGSFTRHEMRPDLYPLNCK